MEEPVPILPKEINGPVDWAAGGWPAVIAFGMYGGREGVYL